MKLARSTAMILVMPWVATFAAFWLFPILYSLFLGFTDYELLRPTYSWVGLDNYRALLIDSDFRSAIKNTATFVVGTIPVTTVLALLMALLVNRKFAGRDFFRASFFIPSITSMVVVALVFTTLYSRGGYVELLAEMVGVDTPLNGFLNDSDTALYAIMGMDVWMSSGYYMLIFLAGLKSIPVELYESAEINGAGAIRQFWSITLPLLRPTALFIIVINTIKSFQAFVEILVMTKGKFDTTTMVYHIYETGLTTQFRFGYASAAAYLLFCIIAIFSIVQFFLLRRRSAW
jgi:multiple sugar transport system permease protein